MSETVIPMRARTEPPPALPMAAPLFTLRVLNGKQQGAEIALKTGRYQLGTEEDNDIVLMGEAIEGRHLEMFFAEGRATLTHLEKEIYINNQSITQPHLPLELEAKQVVMVGGVALSINESSDPWPQLDTIHQDVIETLALVQAAQAPGMSAMLQALFHNKQRAALSVFGCSFAVSVLIVLIAFSLHTTQKPQSIAAAAADRLVEQLASNPVYEHVRLIHSEPKKQLIGYVARTQDLNRLHNFNNASLVDMNIVSVEKIDKSLNIISDAYGGNLSYQLVPRENRKMHLLLYGTIEKSHQRETMRSILRRDLSSITSIEIDVITRNEALEIVNTWLSAYPDFAGLKAVPKSEGIFIQGNLLGNAKKRWKTALLESPPDLPQNMLPFIDIYFSPPFTGKIISFVTGARAQLRIFYKDKTILASVGDRVRGGFMIKDIQRDKIILSWRSRNLIYPLPKQ